MYKLEPTVFCPKYKNLSCRWGSKKKCAGISNTRECKTWNKEEEIDREITTLYKAIDEAKQHHVPTITHRVLPHFKNTPTIKRLLTDLDNIKISLQQNFTPAIKRRYNLKLTLLRQEYSKENVKEPRGHYTSLSQTPPYLKHFPHSTTQHYTCSTYSV